MRADMQVLVHEYGIEYILNDLKSDHGLNAEPIGPKPGTEFADKPGAAGLRALVTEDHDAAVRYAAAGGCVIGVTSEEELRERDFPEAYVLVTDREALTENFIRKSACHFYGIPFEAASTAWLSIRESTAQDYETIFSMLERSAALAEGGRIFADGFDLSEIGTQEKFLAYVRACYNFFGFGVWTVALRERSEIQEEAETSEAPQYSERRSDAGAGAAGRSTDGRVIGWCGLFPKKDEGEAGYHIELGYVIDPEQQGQGYGYEACRAILDYAWEELGLAEIIVRTAVENEPAQRLAEKLGFRAVEEQDGVVHYSKRIKEMRLL